MPVCVWELQKVFLYFMLVAKTTIKPLLIMSLQQKNSSETVEVNSFILYPIINSKFKASFFSYSKITFSGFSASTENSQDLTILVNI